MSKGNGTNFMQLYHLKASKIEKHYAPEVPVYQSIVEEMVYMCTSNSKLEGDDNSTGKKEASKFS